MSTTKTGLHRLVLWAAFSPLLILYYVLKYFGGRRGLHVKDYRTPPLWLTKLITLPLAIINPPRISGIEHVPKGNGKKLMLVGNQVLLGLDQHVLVTLIYDQCGFFCRRMHDTLFGKIPILREVLALAGGVVGTKRNCEQLMELGQPFIFYPGGIDERFKNRGVEKYSLGWGERLGFIRLAIKHDYTLVPFASVGLEDALWHLFSIPLQPALSLLFGDKRLNLHFPVIAPLNSCERQYFAFGEAVATTLCEGEWEDTEKCLEIYEKLYTRVSGLVQEARDMQAQDPGRYPLGRVWVTVKGVAGGVWWLGLGGGMMDSSGSSGTSRSHSQGSNSTVKEKSL